MKKLIIKTTVITLSAIIIFLAVSFGIVCIVKPSVIASVFDDLGYYSAANFFYEMQYEQTEDINDLAVLIDRSFDDEDKKDLEQYLSVLISHKDFDSFCDNKNSSASQLQKMTAQEYYAGYYVSVLIDNGKANESFIVSKSFVEAFGYTEYNPFRTIVEESFSKLSDAEKDQLKSTLSDFNQTITDSVQLEFLAQDLDKFN